MANFSIDNLAYVNEHLAANNYLNGDHPGADDAKFFIALNGMPPKKQFPQIYFWYLNLNLFAPATRAQWISAASPKKQELKKDAHKKKQQKQAGNDDINHFENDNVDAEIKVKAEQRKAKTLAQNNQQKPVVKKMVIFEFKLFETIDQAQLEQIVKKIKDNINPNGLVWGQNVDYKDIPFGAKKIVMSMIIEDDKIIIEDIFDQITSLEDDISVVDIVSPCRL
ncbi:unnamed protein product (macronuclear) [Paramecium tetraurelia]|uniref:Translation elongation factor EF1B beta/delta subunit guanine nucleotide exchange domain-containing protein n=1 Tax=Paramecium tetraurelia TaxID=5888 RepID=A0EFC9_PARTE|nr:uncharacterized protein GSPATT00026343001 [Paramecium tetraurelia]CAK94020.1 unnamed protein product [Paramecium tetraurelia]|eukprot:XP_001461393.1 hypothetical protein (macronuclear) [Paramecium tetraurelia strain d4-2]